MDPLYSICMCNYNMAHTLERAVSSVAAQLDERFEIVLLDDGSSDDSVSIMHVLAARYPIIRVVPLRRDRARKLGETRNVSIREARGAYCLLHVDCDDVWEPHLIAWVEVFHQIEAAIGADFLLAGRQVHMAKRSLLLAHGPYPNIFRGEDRAMYARFAALGLLWHLEHRVFRTRLPHPHLRNLRHSVVHTIDLMILDFRRGLSPATFIRRTLASIHIKSLKLVLFRLSVLPLTWCLSKFAEPISYGPMLEDEKYGEYRKTHRGTMAELMGKQDTVPDWSRLPHSSRSIFDGC